MRHVSPTPPIAFLVFARAIMEQEFRKWWQELRTKYWRRKKLKNENGWGWGHVRDLRDL